MLDGRFGVLLPVQVERGADGDPAQAVNVIGGDQVRCLLAHHHHEMRRQDGVGGRVVNQRLGRGQGFLFSADHAGFRHQGQHHLLALPGGIRMLEGIVSCWRLGEARQQSGFRQIQLGGRRPEIGLAGSLDPVSQAAVVHLVEIKGQDLAFRQRVCQVPGQHSLAQLAPQAAVGALAGAEQQAAGHLLGEGAAARQGLAALQVDPGGTQDAAQVDPGVLVEAAVLGGDGGLLQRQRDGCQVHHRVPPAVRIEGLVQQAPAAVHDAQAGQVELAGDRSRVGQVADPGCQCSQRSARQQQDCQEDDQPQAFTGGHKTYRFGYPCLWIDDELAAAAAPVHVGEVKLLGGGRDDVEGADRAGAHQVGIDVGAWRQHIGR